MIYSSIALSVFPSTSITHYDALSPYHPFVLPVLALLAGLIIICKKKGEGSGKLSYLRIFFPVFYMVLLIFTKGFTMTALKGFALFLILYAASVSDIKSRQVPDAYSIMILLTGLIETELQDLPAMFFALVVVGLPQFIVAAVKPGSYGGADIKVTAASAFLLGAWKGLFAIIVGLLAAVVIPCITRLFKKQSLKEGIPMIPYLSFGITLAFIL